MTQYLSGSLSYNTLQLSFSAAVHAVYPIYPTLDFLFLLLLESCLCHSDIACLRLPVDAAAPCCAVGISLGRIAEQCLRKLVGTSVSALRRCLSADAAQLSCDLLRTRPDLRSIVWLGMRAFGLYGDLFKTGHRVSTAAAARQSWHKTSPTKTQIQRQRLCTGKRDVPAAV